MKTIHTLICTLAITTAGAQTSDSTTSLDVLRSPANAAFNLLGISPSSIERPTDLNAFRVSVQSASGNFSQLPSDYAVELAPATIFKSKSQTLSTFNRKEFKYVFPQSLSLSLGLTHGNRDDKETTDSGSFIKVGIGVKFSIIRPHWSSKTENLYQELRSAQRAHHQSYRNAELQNARIAELEQDYSDVEQSAVSDAEKERARKQIVDRMTAVRDSIHTAYYDTSGFKRLNEAAKNFKVERPGDFLDFAAGIALDFPDNRFNYSLTSKAGAWLTGGYDGGNNGVSVLAIARYLYQPDKIFADTAGKLDTAHISTFDAGARLLLTKLEGKLTLSAEGIYRSVLNKNTIDPNWRFTLNTEYDIGHGKKLTLALGKNFDGSISKSGNIIAALNFIAGFGSIKKLQ